MTSDAWPWLPDGFAFLSGYVESVRRRRVLVPMQVIADDSGSKGQGTHIVMAGLSGPATAWATFSDHWAACLKESPSISHFKMYDAVKRIGPFAGFSSSARDAKLVALAKVMNEYPFDLLRVSVDLAEHERIFGPVADALAKPKRRHSAAKPAIIANPYFYVYHVFIGAACYHLWNSGHREQFDFIVDVHPKHGNDAAYWYPLISGEMPEPMRAIMPVAPVQRDDLKFLPLQGADLVAWLQRRGAEGTRHHFGWLQEHLTNVRASDWCVDLDAAFLDRMERAAAADLAAGIPKIETLNEIRRLLGQNPPPHVV